MTDRVTIYNNKYIKKNEETIFNWREKTKLN